MKHKYFKWLCLLLMLLGISKVQANDIYTSDIQISSFYTSDGILEIRIPIYDDDGADEGLDYKANSYINVTIDGVNNGNPIELCRMYSFKGDGDPQGSASWYWVKIKKTQGYDKAITKMTAKGDGNDEVVIGDGYTQVNSDKNGSTKSFAYLKFYMNANVLEKSATFKVHLRIDKNNSNGDYDLDASSTSIKMNGIPTLDVGALTNTGTSGEKKVTARATGGSGNSYDANRVYIGESGSLAQRTSFEETYTVTEDVQNKSIYLEYRMSENRTIRRTESFAIPQYRHINSFKATNGPNGSTKLEWGLAGKNDITPREDTGEFILMKKVGTGSYQQFKTLNNSTFTDTDNETINTPEKISYKIYWSKPWTDYLAKEVEIDKTGQKHAKVTEFTSGKLLTQRNVELRWKWNYDEKSTNTVLTPKSKFILIREISLDGKNFNVDETIELECDKFKNSEICIDTVSIPQSCVLYQWKIQLKPGETYSSEPELKVLKYYITKKDPLTGKPIEGQFNETTEGINDKEVASLEYFNSSHGYYGDRVELDWKLDQNSGSLDVFSVQRREYGETDTALNPFIQIGTVDTSNGIIYYSYTDTKAVPGVMYEYLIEGTKECANEEVKTQNYSYGFCTPTGNIYGRITFDSENGQAVQDAEVRLETTTNIIGKSYHFKGDYFLEVNDSKFLDTETDSLSFQLFVKFETQPSSKMSLLEKAGMYELYAQNNKLHFNVGNQTLDATKDITALTANSSFIQITAICAGDSLFLYANGENIGKVQRTTGKLAASSNVFTMGKSLKGYLDEVRVWNKPLSKEEIKKTFDRYLAGDEEGLIAYWTFNYATSKEFYDFAHEGTKFYMNDGKIRSGAIFIENAELSNKAENNPSLNQLGYKDYTNNDGSYYITGIPYVGNGTLYSIIPRLGVHEFSPTKSQVTLSAGNVNHSANFVDKSSFPVSGTITYKGGTIPVEGVQFYVDGVVCSDSKGNIVTSDAKGKFAISVPVGTHEVKAHLANHVFANEGRLVDDYGNDINYQDDRYSTVKITDNTTVRYIGRVAGGAVQEALKVGHSLSKNNLADNITIQLTYENAAYKLNSNPSDSLEVKTHFLPGNWKDEHKQANTNTVSYRGSGNVVTITPNAETGEFVADLLPISYAVKVNVPGYSNISGNNSKLNLADAFVSQSEINSYVDSILEKNKYKVTNYNDTVTYNKKQQFIARVKPTINVEQVDGVTPLEYFGDEQTSFLGSDGSGSVKLYENGKYLLGLPLFTQGNTYKLKASVYEEYPYYKSNGDIDEDKQTDKVPSQDAVLNFQATMRSSNDFEEIEADSTGVAYWTFVASKVDLTSASANINVKATVGNSDNATSIAWTSPFNENNLVIAKGSVSKGNNFITGGPDKVLAVLRDPPGSNSFSFLEKGTTFTESSQYTGGITQEGNENLKTNIGYELTTFTGVGVGTIQTVEQTNSGEVKIEHSEEWTNAHTKSSTTTTSTTISTSAEEDYVGAMADVFVGYSTNISYGSADAITLVSREKYNADPSFYPIVYKEVGDYVLVQTSAFEAGTNFGTMFAYPQMYIKDYLLPNMETLRNSFLHPQGEMSEARFQAEANATGKPIYVSKLPADDENYGKSNLDEIFKNEDNYYTKPEQSVFDGPSYKIYYPANAEQRSDTINFLNQSMDKWIERLKDNEKAKVEAITNGEVLQNYSLQAGASIEYSKGYSNVDNRTNTFNIVIGGGFANDTEFNAFGTGFVFEFEEKISTTQGGEFEKEEEATTTVGFTLADSGNDYFTVDVYREPGGDNEEAGFEDINSKDLNLSTFIFRTRAGATSCPYEDEEVTEFYKPGTVISEKTLQIEVPEIAVENEFIDNVPSGEPAYVTLYLRNNSAINEDGWFDLIIDDQANQLGAGLKMDGAAIGNGRTILVPAGETLTKILEVTKGPGLNYDNLQLVLASQCQGDPTGNFPAIADTVSFSVHFTPSCSNVTLKTPANNWTYNTNMPTETNSAGIEEHYMNVQITDFNVNYDNFKSIKLMYKPSSNSDENWITLMNYFNNEEYYNEAVKNGLNAEMIKSEDKGTITYKWHLDDMPDQNYDLCAVTVCNINNVDVENFSPTYSGVKDMYRPRLFGTPQPSNGILTINDDAKITFNESIAAGYLTENNFEVTGIKNGTTTDHSVAVEVDGNDTFVSELNRSFRAKDITFEAWVKLPVDQNATFFKHGKDDDQSLSFGITAQRQLTATVNGKVYTSEIITTNDYLDNWIHVAMVLDQQEDGVSTGKLTLYCNFVSYLEVTGVPAYTQTSTYSIANRLNGQIHNIRIWTEARSSGQIQVQSNQLLSGNEENLLSYYPMDEAMGTVLKDKARGLNLAMTGGTWILPEGRSAVLNGTNSYLKINSGGSIVIDSDNDYTIELWFKGDNTNSDATLLANGKADGTDWGGSENLFFLGFENGVLTYRSNTQNLTGKGNYLDDNWHHVAVAVNRMTSRAQLYVDGTLTAYADATAYGKIGSAYIYAGVTPLAINGMNNTYVNYFNGSIDDVRFWNLYKNETSVKEGMTTKLDGSEMGLLAYYPFEKHTVTSQNIPVVRFSLEDAKVPAATATKTPDATAVIGETEFASITESNRLTVEDAFMTSAIAPVKDKGGVVDLLFDFVVNNDALIVTLKEDAAKIEKTTVTITVSDVRDLNGNSISSPITWTAYIDRNQLKWGEDEISLVKNVDEPLTFTVDAVNKGGYTEDYTISNNPSWMDVEPTNGTLTATKSQAIKFTVDESVNIGTYNEVIYLTNSEGVSEPLNLTLKVNGIKPDWSVNPADYKFNMNVYGKMKINDKFSNDTEDILAAFVNDTCVGIANNQYIKVNDTYYALLTIYSNVASRDSLDFKMWDASIGTTYVAMPEKKISFKANSIIGTPVDPIVFSNLDLVQLDIALNNGWTWTSFNVTNKNMEQISNVLKNNKWLAGDEVKREDGGVATYGTETGWVTDSLRSFDNKGMFMIRSSYAQTLSVIGTPVDVTEEENILTINSVNKDKIAVWNYIPYLAQNNLTLNEALAGYEANEGDVIKSQSGFAMYNNNLGWIGSLTYMQPGRGYMLQRVGTTDATLQYPSAKTQTNRAATRAIESKDEAMEDLGYENSNYSRTMSMVATVAGVEVNEGDVLKAYVNGELRGESPIICSDENEKPLFYLSIAGNIPENIDVTIERNGKVIAAASGTATFDADKVEGSFETPVVITFVDNNNMTVYPSPFVSELFIRKQVAEDDNVTVTISDVKGSVIAIFENCNKDGQVNIHWTNAANCTPGVYIVNINVNGENNIYKVTKIKI